jgi:hypothetical protein
LEAFYTSLSRTLLALVVFGISILLGGCSIEEDRRDAEVIAASVHNALRNGSFAEIYQNSAAPFKAVGSEAQFVAGLNDFKQRLGILKKETEINYVTGFDSKFGRTHTLVFDLQFEKGRARESMMLVRSVSGTMELWRLDIEPLH